MPKWKKNLYILWLTQILYMTGFGFCTPFCAFYFQELGLTSPAALSYQVGLSTALTFAFNAISCPLWGMASDRIGYKNVILVSNLLNALLVGAQGFVASVPAFQILRAFQGAVSGIVPASMGLVSQGTPKKNMTFALGLITSATSVGYTLGPVIGGILGDMFSYSTCFISGGILLFFGFVLTLLFVDGEERAGEQGCSEADKAKTKTASGAKLGRFSAAVLVPLMIVFFAKVARSLFSPYLALYIQELRGSIDGAAAMTGVISGAASLALALSAVTLTYIADRRDKYKVLILLTVLSIPLYFALPLARTTLIFAVIYTVLFYVVGGIEPILNAVVVENMDSDSKGTLFGWITTINSIASMAAPMIAAFVSAQIGLKAVLYTMAVIALLQLILFVLHIKHNNGFQGKIATNSDAQKRNDD